MSNGRKPPRRLTRNDERVILKLLDEGIYQHHIAAMFGVNQGRISEVKQGKYDFA